jgi:hypothetical protein
VNGATHVLLGIKRGNALFHQPDAQHVSIEPARKITIGHRRRLTID